MCVIGDAVREHLGRVGVLLLDDVALEQVAQAVGVAVGRDAGPVVDAVERDHRPAPRVDVLEARLALGIVGGEPDHRGEVTAGRAAGDDDVVGVAAVLGDVLAHPGERALAVDEMRRATSRGARGDS